MAIHHIDCPNCRNVNWFNNGDESDLTVPDVEAIRCWSCRHEFFTEDDPAVIELCFSGTTPPESFIKDGQKLPSG